jgi:hypothetical protein
MARTITLAGRYGFRRIGGDEFTHKLVDAPLTRTEQAVMQKAAWYSLGCWDVPLLHSWPGQAWRRPELKALLSLADRRCLHVVWVHDPQKMFVRRPQAFNAYTNDFGHLVLVPGDQWDEFGPTWQNRHIEMVEPGQVGWKIHTETGIVHVSDTKWREFWHELAPRQEHVLDILALGGRLVPKPSGNYHLYTPRDFDDSTDKAWIAFAAHEHHVRQLLVRKLISPDGYLSTEGYAYVSERPIDPFAFGTDHEVWIDEVVPRLQHLLEQFNTAVYTY